LDEQQDRVLCVESADVSGVALMELISDEGRGGTYSDESAFTSKKAEGLSYHG
jgi:hypothetical protein